MYVCVLPGVLASCVQRPVASWCACHPFDKIKTSAHVQTSDQTQAQTKFAPLFINLAMSFRLRHRIPTRPTRSPPPLSRRCPGHFFPNSFGNQSQKVPVFHRAQSTFSCSLKCKLDGNEVYILANKALDLHEKLRKF